MAFGILKVQENGVSRELYFASVIYAQEFKDFVGVYMSDSGAGNGYGAYWCKYDQFIDRVIDESNARFYCGRSLDHALVIRMWNDICIARTAERNHGVLPNVRLGLKNGAIFFELDELPARQNPKQGDMFRVVKNANNLMELIKLDVLGLEGRVLEERQDTVVVIASHQEGDDGNPIANAQLREIPTKLTMKINDWKSEMCKARV